MGSILEFLILVGIVLVAVFAIMTVFARLYKRATKEISFVRTGLGGQKVVMNGGAIVLPVLHDTIPVNMNTLRLAVRRADNAALITQDRMRVDVLAEFYVRVQPTQEAIANAAQTLGLRTMRPEQLKELVEGKFVDALRAVAAELTMEQLHEKRVDFVRKVQAAVSEDLLKNGLELESVSLTGLDQTSREHFNPDNAFDAAGLTKLTAEIEERRKRRNEIERESEVAIELQNLDTDRKKLEIQRDNEYARLEQEREVELRRAAQSAEIARERAEQQMAAKNAEIQTSRETELSRIRADRSLEQERLESQRALKERDIEMAKVVDLAQQDSQIAVAQKSKAQSEARAQADIARAQAVEAEEKVATAREKEIAERQKAVFLVKAQQEAEEDAISIKVQAEAKRQAAEDEAEALRTLAQARSEEVRIAAQGEADSERLRAEAAELRYKVEAEGNMALNKADNSLSRDVIEMKIRMAIIENLANIIEQSVKPMERIEAIKIMQLDGLHPQNGGGHGGSGESGDSSNPDGGGLADQLVTSALRYRSQAPLVDALMREVGMGGGGDLGNLTAALKTAGFSADEIKGAGFPGSAE